MAIADSLEGRNLILFYIIAFGFSWAFWIPQALHAAGMIPSSAFTDMLASPLNPAAWGPLVAAIVVTGLSDGKAGVLELLGRAKETGFKKVWWLAVFVLLPLIALVSFLIGMTTEGYTPVFDWAAEPIGLVIAFPFILFLGGPLQEEFGWRGYALPRFQSRFNAVTSAIVVGLMWGFWHLPLFFIPNATVYYDKPIWGLLISTVLISIIITWVFNNTNGSILAALMIHTMFNWSHYAMPVLATDLGSLAFIVLQGILAIAVIVYWGPKRLTRESPQGQ